MTARPSLSRTRTRTLTLMLMLTLMLTLLLPLLAAPPALAAPLEVLSVSGEVRVGGSPLEAPRSIPAGSSLTVGAGGQVLLLLPAAGDRGELAVAVLGPARLYGAGQAAEVELVQGGRLRASGSGQLLLHGLWLLTLRESSAVLDGEHLFLVRGSGSLEPRRPLSFNPAAALFGGPHPPAAVRVQAGQRASLGPGGSLTLAQGAPSPELVAAPDHVVPPVWRPVLPRVSLAEVRRAERTSSEQRRAERETASCGCTESKGASGAPLPGAGPGMTPLERQAARLRVRVIGVPRSE